MKRLAVLFVVFSVVGLILAGCGSTKATFVGKWESTGGSELSLQVDAPTDGAYPVTFAGGDIETKMSATRVNDTDYQAEPEFLWTFHMVGDGLMTVKIAGDGESATTTFKRVGD